MNRPSSLSTTPPEPSELPTSLTEAISIFVVAMLALAVIYFTVIGISTASIAQGWTA